jgi:hypothetical protein
MDDKIKIKGDKGTKGRKDKNKKNIYSSKHIRNQIKNKTTNTPCTSSTDKVNIVEKISTNTNKNQKNT